MINPTLLAQSPPPARSNEPGADPAAQAFHLQRRDMLAALHAWLMQRPAAEDVEAEIAGTVSAMRQLHGAEA